MGRPKKLTFVQKYKSAIVDMIWMSIRYCIGRHTIAAAMHADQLAKLIGETPEFTEAEKKHFAQDIIRCINEVVGHGANIKIRLYNEHDRYDALSLLMEYAKNYDKPYGVWSDEVFKKSEYELDCLTNNIVDIKDYEESGKWNYIHTLEELEIDLNPWVRLAQYLDPKYEVVYKNLEGETVTEPAIKYYSFNRNHPREETSINERIVPVHIYEENPYRGTYLAPEFILKVNKL